VASIAIVSAIGVSYLFENLKEKKDRDLREEIKGRVGDDVKRTAERIDALEQS